MIDLTNSSPLPSSGPSLQESPTMSPLSHQCYICMKAATNKNVIRDELSRVLIASIGPTSNRSLSTVLQVLPFKRSCKVFQLPKHFSAVSLQPSGSHWPTSVQATSRIQNYRRYTLDKNTQDLCVRTREKELR